MVNSHHPLLVLKKIVESRIDFISNQSNVRKNKFAQVTLLDKIKLLKKYVTASPIILN